MEALLYFALWAGFIFLMMRFGCGAHIMGHGHGDGRTRAKSKHVGDFELRYLASDGSDFDFGIDYIRCRNLELARRLGAEGFAPYVCMSDIELSNALDWGLIRTQTLADGCSHCDFRFKRGAETRISSKTPEVQETVERIEQRSPSS